MKQVITLAGNHDLEEFIEAGPGVESIDELDTWTTEFIKKTGKKTVLIIDEVDKSCNNQLFLDFLGLLRAKYL